MCKDPTLVNHADNDDDTDADSAFADATGPNDRQQMEGLDLTHHWMTLLFDDKLFLAPIGDNPQRILDVGTGTGIWAIDVADMLPSAELNWVWQPNYFDYIHIRHLGGCIDDWPRLYGQAFSRLKPGGYFESCDYDIQTRSESDLVGPDHIYTRWYETLLEASEKSGRSFQFPPPQGSMRELMERAGFEDVVYRCWKIPIGAWPRDKKMKQLGLFTAEFIDGSIEGFALYL
ncbi:unnamed protein product [Parascedosporium putredinis]|uniref:S-adenosyl-L-methionine-dependent methyltransferase n=1 Tax=Parascedosporium putredinis TaxID=1442378 RepID=A0A9P1M879_9PEZI|nr:unnamed protein product [Parascedosporium putredinis]CAI7992131.1 unnamed protein product [Parascedosporium putredinis]